MPFPVFASGDVLNASDMNAVGAFRINNCTVTSSGGTAATASNGVITIGNGNTSLTINSAFSTNYDNYLVLMNATTALSGEAIRLQLGSTTTGYYGNLIYANYLSGAPASIGDNNATIFRHISGADGVATSMILFISNPFAASRTLVFSPSYRDTANAGQYNGFVANNTSYTAFTLSTPSGSLTGGTIRVYGYQK